MNNSTTITRLNTPKPIATETNSNITTTVQPIPPKVKLPKRIKLIINKKVPLGSHPAKSVSLPPVSLPMNTTVPLSHFPNYTLFYAIDGGRTRRKVTRIYKHYVDHQRIKHQHKYANLPTQREISKKDKNKQIDVIMLD
eukprot:177114_1